jgi:hypothetical protein
VKQYPLRFIGAYIALGVVALTALIAFVVIMLTPVTPVAHKSDIRAALGGVDTKALLAQAEEAIGQEAAANGLTITQQKLVKVTHPKTNEVVLTLKVTTAQIGTVTLVAPFHKGIYSLGQIRQQ